MQIFMQKGVELKPDLERQCVSLVRQVPPLLPISNVPQRLPRKDPKSGEPDGEATKRQSESQDHSQREKGQLRSGGKS